MGSLFVSMTTKLYMELTRLLVMKGDIYSCLCQGTKKVILRSFVFSAFLETIVSCASKLMYKASIDMKESSSKWK
jgi:hypothetical protein